jgi:hypothetical protein
VEIEINPASADALELMTVWRYPPPYDFYDGDASSRIRRTSTTASVYVPT